MQPADGPAESASTRLSRPRILEIVRLMLAVLLLGLQWQPVPTHGGSILREVYEGIPGGSVSDLLNASIYPNSPTSTNYLTTFFEAPTDVLENYGQRLRGFVIPPVSGNYTFWIASDDGGALYLSSDELPAHKSEIASVNGWTSSREWNKEPNQQSLPVFLSASKPYYVEALMKEGGGGDNLAVRWLRPDGVDQGPIPATYLLPWGVAFIAPKIVQQPQDTTAVEGQNATFTVVLDPLSPASYQWQHAQVDIPGATTQTLTYGPVALNEKGTKFRVRLSNQFGNTNSTEATLDVTPDVTKPTLVGALNLGATTVRVIFDEPMAATTATLASNYKLDHGAGVTAAAFGADTKTILLTVSPLAFGTTYTLTVDQVTDRANKPNAILPGSQLSFLALEYAPTDVGTPAVAGGVTRINGTAFDVTGGGADIGEKSDQFQFAWELRTGDFDQQARVDGTTVPGQFLHAGLMARETLDSNARFAAVFASSPELGCFFESRASVAANSATASIASGFPVNYPQTWLRLRRSGTVLTGYASRDGQSWVQLGSRTLSSLGATIYFGLAVTGGESQTTATARFRDLGPTTSSAVGTFVPTGEPLGASSRRTGIVISEIMYHPAARPDAKNLEYIELYNSGSVFEDFTGWRLSGDVEYAFPDGFTLAAGEFMVVAATPADLVAVAGPMKVLGPFTGSLPNAGGRIQVRSETGAVRLEVNYSDNPPWPVAADGAGHSLVLARPSYGEDDPEAWAPSELIGGSPGRVDTYYPTPLRGVVINEFLTNPGDTQVPFVELYNPSNTSIDLTDCILTDDAAFSRFRIAAGTSIPARGFVAFDQGTLGFALEPAGGTVHLMDPARTRVLDAVHFGGQEKGVASGRSPDGAATIRRLSTPTRNSPNASWRLEDIVINELMYAPISGNDDDEYIELLNRSTAAIDLGGWWFSDGVDFKFPPSTSIPAGSYLVIARNQARLRGNYPQLNTANTFGDFTGTLANSGERLALSRPATASRTNEFGDVITSQLAIVVTEVRWAKGGRWGLWSDEGGSSLEFKDPHADPLRPSNWVDSDETAKAPWVNVEVTGKLEMGNDIHPPDRFHIGLQGAGECLVDEIEVIPSGGGNRITNGGFESGSSGWEFFGNHSKSSVDTTGAVAGTRCLHVRGQGDGDTGPNSIRANLTGLSPGSTATIRAKVRWLAGWPEILFRLRGNWLELPARMPLPANLGTPGLPNSRLVPNAGPAIYDVTHNPPLPKANQAVIVTCRVSDPDGLKSLTLRARNDSAGTSLAAVTLRDDGTLGDAVAGDGIFSGQLGGQGTGTVVAFRIEATDNGATPVTAIFPPNYPTGECLIRWDDPVPLGTFGHYHLWNTQATDAARDNPLDNTYRDCTLVHGNSRVIYNAGFRDKGSPYHGGGGDYAVTVPEDDRLLGVTDRIFASTGNGESEATGVRSQVSAWIARQMGIPYLNARYLQVWRNGQLHRNVSEDLEQPNTNYAEYWQPDAEPGDLYKIAIWFEFQDDNRGFDSIQSTIESFRSGNAYKQARYRWTWQTRGYLGTANNYSNVFDLVGAVNASTDYVNKTQNLASMEEWMRVFAYHRILGNWDSWTFGVGQNMYAYKQPGVRWTIFPWDIDFVLGLGNGANDGLWGGQDPVANTRFFDSFAFRRMMWRAYQDATSQVLLPARYQPQIDARQVALHKNGIQDLNTDTAGISKYIEDRRNYIIGELKANDTTTFAVTSNNGNNFTSTTATANLEGTAPFAVATVEVNGVPYPVTWIDYTRWRISVILTGVSNALTIRGLDLRGHLVPGATDTITVTYNGAIPQPIDWVAINEIHYNPTEPNASFVELHNRHTTVAFDLSGFRLEGVGYTFPDGAFIGANNYLLLAKDRAAFALSYGATIPVSGEFPGSLDNGGETLKLVKPGFPPAPDTVISDVRYDNQLPWPLNADGLGSSLQRIDPAQDGFRVGNWTATPTNDVNRVTPGRANSVKQTLPPFPLVWLNEVMPNNVNSIMDSAADHDPWIELYNSGDTAIDLTPYYLTDSYSNLTKWQFPAGLSIPPRQFLIVWADGEPGESIPGAPHTSFRIDPSTGSLALVRMQGSPAGAAVMDYLDYVQLAAGRAFGSYPDGEPRKRRLLYFPTPGALNDPTSPEIHVTINEFMAGNTSTIADTDGDFEDWIELYNAGPGAVDLTSYTLTDDLTNPAQFTIPPGTVIPDGGHLLIWADDETSQNHPGGDLHTNFKLALATEHIGLFAPDGTLVDGFTYPQQTNDISMGRFPDGADPPLFFMETPTPRAANVLAGANRPPTLLPIGDKSAAEQQLLQFTAQASDLDAGQSLTFSLGADAPAGTEIDAAGHFTWVPDEAQGPGSYSFSVRVTDNGSPPRSSSERITVTVTEVNRKPALPPIDDRQIDEGSLLAFDVVATDPDRPDNPLTYGFDGAVPEGAAIDSATGRFTWTPAESQGGAVYSFTVRVADRGSPELTDSRTFHVTVNEVNNPPALDFVQPQTIDEMTPLTVTVSAHDPDSPPSALRYSFDKAPSTAQIDPVTGVVTWTPGEADGPATHIFIVRATELSPPGLSDARTFGVIVREVNRAPKLGAIPPVTVLEGGLARFTAAATDPDLPVNPLTYSIVSGSPAGAQMDPSSGVFTWNVPGDIGPNTYQMVVQVSDNGSPPLTDTTTATLTVAPRWHVVFNELMHHPAAANGRYIELLNSSTNTPHDLSGLVLTGSDFSFTFPAGTQLPPKALLCVAENVSAFRAAYGAAKSVVGPWSGTWKPRGTLRIQMPSKGGAPGEVLTTLTLSDLPPWPAAANGGAASLQLIDAARDPDRVGNWSATTAYAGPRELIVMTNEWRYYQDGPQPDTNWRSAAFNDLAWPTGRALLYVEESDLPADKNTLLTLGQLTYYFRTRFTIPTVPSGASLRLSSIMDDGMVVWLNGHELFRLGMPEGDPVFDTAASRTVGNAVLEGPFTVPADPLVAGENSVAVEVHQRAGNSSDIVLGLTLDLEGGNVTALTPGDPNSVAGLLPEFPTLRINEVLNRNVTGIRDSAGEREPWIELANNGPNPVSLDGLYLTDDYRDLTRWAIPPGHTVPAGGFVVIFADGQPAQTTAAELHAGFRLVNATLEPWSLALVRLQSGQPAVIDYLDGTVPANDHSNGRLPDSDPASNVALPAPTPGAANQPPPPNQPPQLAPIGNRAVDEGALLTFHMSATDPDANQTLTYSLDPGAPATASLNAQTGEFSWTPGEADGPGNFPFTFRVTDSAAEPASDTETITVVVNELNLPPQLAVPPDSVIAPGQAFDGTASASDDDLPGQTLTFTLENAPAGMTIGSTTGAIHWLTAGNQTPGIYPATVRVTDNGSPSRNTALTFEVTVKSAAATPPVLSAVAGSDGSVTLRWDTLPGIRYRLEYRVRVEDPEWQLLHEFTATEPVSSFVDRPAEDTRYYRVVSP